MLAELGLFRQRTESAPSRIGRERPLSSLVMWFMLDGLTIFDTRSGCVAAIPAAGLRFNNWGAEATAVPGSLLVSFLATSLRA